MTRHRGSVGDFEAALAEAIRRAQPPEPAPTDPPVPAPVLDEAPTDEALPDPDLDALLAAARADVVVPPRRRHSTATERALAVRAWRRLTDDHGLLRVPAAARLADALGVTYQSVLGWVDTAPRPVPPADERADGPARPAPVRRPFSQLDLHRESLHDHFTSTY